MIGWIFSHHQKIGLAVALAACVYYLVVWHRSGKALDEKLTTPIITIAFAGYSIPECILLLYCCFDTSRLNEFDDYPLYLGVTALSALLIAVVAILNAVKGARK